ncbi:helix-turn-helix transcriptional regulator [Hymenobacter psychrophilus]|uniref:DNA binding domain-containing protein, excisionase family n=1 Tax=Hymenobacter psychrophilus TaxID=651662 RepID=A0A1H3DQZ5_9BACT|nr:helix-turn-helix domain-containing protein [Hymenobacter psychrophilus]SDX68084.1 DNA binding domain-containing protein, excisionase family [Hymenobacter psychrophilus]
MNIEIPDTFLTQLQDKVLSTVLKALNQISTGSALADSPDTKRLYTKDEVCQQLGISKTTLTEWMKNGTVPFLRLGRRIYFKQDEVLQAGRNHEKYQRRR